MLYPSHIRIQVDAGMKIGYTGLYLGGYHVDTGVYQGIRGPTGSQHSGRDRVYRGGHFYWALSYWYRGSYRVQCDIGICTLCGHLHDP